MKQSIIFTLLGTGSSGGVPRVGNQWGVCDPSNPRNRRRRCAMLIQLNDLEQERATTVLIDAGADLREQLLSAQVSHLDAVLLTHSHADHIFGLDDLRQLALSMRSPIPVYMDNATSSMVMQAFNYIFRQAPNSSFPAFCTHGTIEHDQLIPIKGDAGNLTVKPLVAEHGDIHSLGFRIGNVAYLPDVKRVSDQASLKTLEGLDVLILDTLRYKTHPAHMNLEESLAFIKQMAPKRAVLTNLHSDLDYETLLKELPENVTPGFDGLQITHVFDTQASD